MNHREPFAVIYHNQGKPEEVLQLEALPATELKAGEVRIRLLAAVIHPSDKGMIMGSYGRAKELPAVGGREGIGEIVEVGSDVLKHSVGDWVKLPEEQGTWREEVVTSAGELFAIPKHLPVEQMAMAFLNPPTAIRLLEDFGDLQPGDWIVQNAANSAVGFCVVQYARYLGLKTINLVRDLSWQESLSKAGADIVILDTEADAQSVLKMTGGVRPKLGLNSVGGESAMSLCKLLAEGGELVTFGGMVGDKVRFPTRYLIFNDICLRGFWMDKWMRSHSRSEIETLFEKVFQLIEKGVFQIPVAERYTMKDGLKAVEVGLSAGRKGKVLLVES